MTTCPFTIPAIPFIVQAMAVAMDAPDIREFACELERRLSPCGQDSHPLPDDSAAMIINPPFAVYRKIQQ